MNAVKKQLKELMENDYEAFVKALFSLEWDITRENKLDKLYQTYITSPCFNTFLNEDILDVSD